MINCHPGFNNSEGAAYANYPKRFRRTDVITVKERSHIEVDFTFFDVESGGKHCPYDHLTVTDGDGTILINRLCGTAGYGYGYGYGYGNNSSEGNGNSSAVNGSGNGYENISRRQRQDYGNVNGSVNGNVTFNGNVNEISLENILGKTIASHTNVLKFTFVTDERNFVTHRGWSANWRSVTPGLHFTFWHS